MSEPTIDYGPAREAEERVKSLVWALMKARDDRDDAIQALLAHGGRVNELARQIGCSEGAVRLARSRAEQRESKGPEQ